METKKILFVDDDANVLEGLKKSLRNMKEKWEMTFVTSGAEALEILSGSSYDIVVADYRMPSMDGITFLGRVKKRHPHTIRVLLTGQSNEDIYNISRSIAHNYLNKPCHRDELINTLEKY